MQTPALAKTNQQGLAHHSLFIACRSDPVERGANAPRWTPLVMSALLKHQLLHARTQAKPLQPVVGLPRKGWRGFGRPSRVPPPRKGMDDNYVINRPWRTGRSIGRTIYVVVGVEPSDKDEPIGMLDTPGIAQAAVIAHNLSIART